MGIQMAARLQQHLSEHGEGRKLIAWNRTLSKADPLTEQGAEIVQQAAGRQGLHHSLCLLHQPPCCTCMRTDGAQCAAMMPPYG